MSTEDTALSRVAARIAASEVASKKGPENAQAAEDERHALAAEGVQHIRPLLKNLLECAIREAAPAAQLEQDGKAVRLGNGRIVCDLAFPYLESRAFARSRIAVVAGVFLSIQQNSRQYPGRSGNLWYGDLDRSGAYRWWEVAYMGNPMAPSDQRLDTPFGVSSERDLDIADASASVAMTRYQYAYGPKQLDVDHPEVFIRRWAEFLAAAAMNGLQCPRYLPE
jgi:hypothetical protein